MPIEFNIPKGLADKVTADGALDSEEVWVQYICQTGEDGEHDPEQPPDEHVRPSHAAFHAQFFKLNDAPIPPLDYGCRCAIKYVAKPGSDAAAVVDEEATGDPVTPQAATKEWLDRNVPEWGQLRKVAEESKPGEAIGAVQAKARSLGVAQPRAIAEMVVDVSKAPPPATPATLPPEPPAPEPDLPGPAPAPAPAPSSSATPVGPVGQALARIGDLPDDRLKPGEMAVARGWSRDVITNAGMTPRFEETGNLFVDELPTGMRGAMTSTGQMLIDKQVWNDARDGAVALAKGELPEAEEINGIKTLIHEELHAIKRVDVSGPIANWMEEVTTETSARKMVRDLVVKQTGQTAANVMEAATTAVDPTALGGSYGPWLNEYKDMVKISLQSNGVLKPSNDQLRDIMETAAISFRQNLAAFKTPRSVAVLLSRSIEKAAGVPGVAAKVKEILWGAIGTTK